MSWDIPMIIPISNDPGKSYDNRWMHRPVIHWEKIKRLDITGSPEEQIFSGTRRLLQITEKAASPGRSA